MLIRKNLLRSLCAAAAASAFVVAGTASCAGETAELAHDETGDEGVGTAASALTTSAEKALVAKLGRPSRFLVGLGNDVGAAEGWDPNKAHAYTIGPKMDIHYMYLSGLPGEGGWTEYNSPTGYYVTKHVEAAKARGVVPMFTLYQAAAWGDGNLSAMNDGSFMGKYWKGVRSMFERLGWAGVPAIVHLEPDFWGYAQKRGDDPWATPVQVTAHVAECKDLPNNVAGFGKCMVRLSRKLSPKVAVGLSASTFGAYTSSKPDPWRVASFLNKVGGAESDLVIVETLDRDAGCYERASDPNCKRSGTFYWGQAQFTEHLAWAKAIRQGTGKPLLWWQMPLGVASGTWGGWAGKYRDNRVQYLFSKPWEFAQAGGIGAVFGTGAPNQTTAKTDGGQFKNAVTRYLASPAGLN